MNSARLPSVGFLILVAATLLLATLFGSLGVAVETCNVEGWFQVAEQLVGSGPMRVVQNIWVALFVASLVTLAIGLKIPGSSGRYILGWSAFNLIVLIIVRSIELGQSC